MKEKEDHKGDAVRNRTGKQPDKGPGRSLSRCGFRKDYALVESARFIVQVLYKPFGIAPMAIEVWLKCLLYSSSIVAFSEVGKLIYRAFWGREKTKGVKIKATKKALPHENFCKAR